MALAAIIVENVELIYCSVNHVKHSICKTHSRIRSRMKV